MSGDQLREIARVVDMRERALTRLAFCFDVYLNYTENGAPATEHMDAAKATAQLKNAICAAIGLPEDKPPFIMHQSSQKGWHDR